MILQQATRNELRSEKVDLWAIGIPKFDLFVNIIVKSSNNGLIFEKRPQQLTGNMIKFRKI
jgi:hypothetical protein